MDPGDWYIVGSWVLIVGELCGMGVLLRPRYSGAPIALYSAACASVTIPAARAMVFLSEHHDDIEWMSGNVIGSVILLTFVTFVCGLIGAVISASRASRRHQMNVVVFLPWVVYLAIGVFAAMHPW